MAGCSRLFRNRSRYSTRWPGSTWETYRQIAARSKKGVAVVVIVVRTSSLPEQLDLVEQVSFVFWYGHLRAVFLEAWSSPTLVAVVVGVQDPFDTFNTQSATWSKVLPKSFHNVSVGSGYWLYAAAAGILVP